MIKIYGSMLCPDCVKCREELDAAGVVYEYLDFSENLKNLKEFLVIPCLTLFAWMGESESPALSGRTAA